MALDQVGYPAKSKRIALTASTGAGKNQDHVMLLTIGTGIGGGLVVNGDLYRGAFGVANIVSTGKFESEYLTHKHTLEIMELMDLIRDKIGLKYPGE